LDKTMKVSDYPAHLGDYFVIRSYRLGRTWDGEGFVRGLDSAVKFRGQNTAYPEAAAEARRARELTGEPCGICYIDRYPPARERTAA
jgi:hypothetical protein